MAKYECPTHKIPLEPKKTRYGTRWGCVVTDCTVAKWSGQTSTPADSETRQKRTEAHYEFDHWWEGHIRKGKAYKALAEFLGLPQKKTHIGHFNIEQCERVIAFAKAKQNVEEQSCQKKNKQ